MRRHSGRTRRKWRSQPDNHRALISTLVHGRLGEFFPTRLRELPEVLGLAILGQPALDDHDALLVWLGHSVGYGEAREACKHRRRNACPKNFWIVKHNSPPFAGRYRAGISIFKLKC